MLLRNKSFIQKFLAYSHPQGTAYTSHFQAMCETVMNVVISGKRMNLSLSGKASESSGENNLVVV